ncbi:hypothetical protein [Sphingomonas sp.]|uniref:hypothetical protein n=1 Tax=Sphingomonas sp. TaxID=28214 RepID=UPI003AFF93EA
MCAAKPAQRLDLNRMVGLETAATMLGGQRHLADALSIGDRAIRAKLAAERGVTYSDLTLAGKALRARAARLSEHADKLDVLAEAAVHG